MFFVIRAPLYPNEEQRLCLKDHFDGARWVYNDALSWRKMVSKVCPFTGKRRHITKDVGDHAMCARINDLKKRHPWLQKTPRLTMNQAVLDLNQAFQRFFKGLGGFPKYKSRKTHRFSASYPSGIRLDLREKPYKVLIPKAGWMKANVYREVPEGVKIKTCTVILEPTGKYFISLLFDDGAPAKEISDRANAPLGIDLGLTHFLITSDGLKAENPKFIKKAEQNLLRKQRKLSRKEKGSKNREKARILVAKAHEKVANQRKTFQCQLVSQLVSKYDAIGLETLKIKNMMQNHNLARAIGDVGWGSFVARLESKMLESGGHVFRANPFFPSSKLCSVCGYKLDTLSRGTRSWVCPHCNTEHDRDINAAENLKRELIEYLLDIGIMVEGVTREEPVVKREKPKKKSLRRPVARKAIATATATKKKETPQILR